MAKQWIFTATILLFLLGGVPGGSANAPTAPFEEPDPVLVGATDYVIQDPKIYYINNPMCAPIIAGEIHSIPEFMENSTPDRRTVKIPDDLVRQVVGRTSVSGVAPRELFDSFFDVFCNPPDVPDIISDIVSDDQYIYWVSQHQGGLVRISEERMIWTIEPPEVINTHTPRSAELVLVDDYIYMLQTSFDSTGLYRIHKTTGISNQLLSAGQVGTVPWNFQTDGQYLYWRHSNGSGWELRAYQISSGTRKTVATNMISYHPVAGNVVYIGYDDVIRSYDHATGTLSAPIYTSEVPAKITAINADGSALYFIQQQGSFYTLYRMVFGSSAVILYAPPAEPPYQVMHRLERQGSYLFFLHGDQLKRIRTNADIAPLTNLRIDGVEITQSIQSDSNEIPLVRGKRTAVRLFASSDGGDIPGVTARLYRLNSGGSIIDGPLWPVNLDRDSAFLRVSSSPDRDNLNQSFTFFLPPDWVGSSTLRLRAELNYLRYPPEPNYTDNILTTAVINLDASRRLETHFVLFEYESGGSTYRPRYREDYLQSVSWVRRAFPLASAPGGSTDSSPGFRPAFRYLFNEDLGGNIDGTNRHPDCQRRINLTPDEPGYLDDPDLCAAWYVVCPTLDSIRAAEGLDDSIFQVGMVADDGGFPRGWACGRGVTTPSGPRDWGWDFDGSYADWYAGHEIGHSQGRGHTFDDPSYPWPDQKIGDETFRGFDLGDTGLNSRLIPQVYDNNWRDVMSYTFPQWISGYTYLGIKNFLPASAGILGISGGPYLQVSGILYPSAHEADITQVRIWNDLTFSPNPPSPGDYRIRLLNSSGGQLAAYDFTPKEGETGQAMFISEFVPFMAGTARVEITHPGTGKLAWSYVVSSNAPVVTNVQLLGAVSPITGTVTIQWSASDADGDSLSYDVLYSPDNGVSWRAVRMNLNTTSTEVDTNLLPGSLQGRFKVIANDGIRQGEGVSPIYELAMKPPVITVLNPADGQVFVYGEEVYFSAEVYDLQDASLPQASIQWRDQTNFFLGMGTEFSQDNLIVGENVITVRATNSKGLVSNVTFLIYVNDEVAPPAPTLAASPNQIVWHTEEGDTSLQTAEISLTNLGEGEFSVSVTEDAPWLIISPQAGSTPLTITLTADPGSLQLGTTTTTGLLIQGALNGNVQSLSVPVSFSRGLILRPYPLEPSGGRIYLPLISRQ